MLNTNQLQIKCPICSKDIVYYNHMISCANEEHEYKANKNGFLFIINNFYFYYFDEKDCVCVNNEFYSFNKKFDTPKNPNDISIIIKKCLALINFQ